MSLCKFGKNKFINFIADAMIMVGGLGFLFLLLKKVKSGEGLDHYISMAGYDLSYLQALMMFISMPLVGVLVGIIYYFTTKDEKDFKKKYNIKDE